MPKENIHVEADYHTDSIEGLKKEEPFLFHSLHSDVTAYLI